VNRLWRSAARALWLVVVTTVIVNPAEAMSAADAVVALGDLREGARYHAIASLARNRQIRPPLSGSEGAAILQDTTQHVRAASIGKLAPLFKSDLGGQDADAILGPDAALSEGDRYNAIAALARAKRFGPSLGDDASLVVKGTTQGRRAAAIGKIAPYLRTGMPGQSIATILGGPSVLNEGNRYNAIAALFRAGRLRQFLSATELALILDGTTQVARAAAIGKIAKVIAGGLSGEDVSTILGKNGELTEGNRYNAIAALANASKVRADLTGDEIAHIVQGTTGQTRAAAVAKVAKAAGRQADLASQPAITQCDAPRVAIDKPSPTCQERWRTAIFRENVPKVFFATNAYIDRWQAAADAGHELAEYVVSLAELAQFASTVMKVKDGAEKAAQILIKGNSSLLMLGFDLPEETLGVSLASEAVQTVRDSLEVMVAQHLSGRADPMVVPPKLARLAISLLSYANTVRYSRLRNTYTIALEYLRLLYRVGGDQSAFARSLGLAADASVRDCLGAVNRRSFGFPTQLTDAAAFNQALAEKVVNHWTMTISAYAALNPQ
jgi:hypothetical protein